MPQKQILDKLPIYVLQKGLTDPTACLAVKVAGGRVP